MPNPVIQPSRRFVLGLLLLILLALYSGWQSLRYYDITIFTRRYAKYGTVASDSISRLELQLACLRGELAPGERVGFLSPLEGDPWGEVYRWTQYSLAPAIVTGDLVPEKLVAVYPDEVALQQAIGDLTVLHDCQDGIALLSQAGGE